MDRSSGDPSLGRSARVSTAGVAEDTLKIIGGRRPSGRAALIFWSPLATSVAAALSPLPYSNSTVTADTSSLLTDVTSRTCSMVLSSFSMVRVTSASTSCADAPGYTLTTATLGRSESGKRFTGMRR